LENRLGSTSKVGRIGHLVNVVLWAAIFAGVIFQANRLEPIEWSGILWSIGLAGILIAIHRLTDRAYPPRDRSSPAGVAALTGIGSGYIVFFTLNQPDAARLVETVFDGFWPLILGWATAMLVRSAYSLALHVDRTK